MFATPAYALPLRVLLATANADYHALIAKMEQTERITVTHFADKIVCYLIYTCTDEKWAFSDRIAIVHTALLDADEHFIKSMARFAVRLVNADTISGADKILALSVIDCHANRYGNNLCRAAVERALARQNRIDLISMNRALRCLGQETPFSDLRQVVPVRELRHAVLRKLRELAGTRRAPRPDNSALTRFLFVISHIPANERTGAHLLQVKWSITSLLRRDAAYQVMLLVTNEHAGTDGFPWRQYSTANTERINAFLLNEIPETEKSRLHIPRLPEPGNPHFEDSVRDNIDRFSPHVVVRWGGNVESEIFDDYIYASFAYVYCQLNAGNIPDRPFDLYLAHGKRSTFESLPAPDRWRTNVIPLEYKRSTYEREPYCGPPRFVSVLGNGRIEQAFTAYTPAQLAFVENVLDLCSYWTFVGVKNPDAILRTEGLRTAANVGRLRILEHHPDLAGLYAKHDVFLSLPRFTGGAGGLAVAAVEGLVIFTNRESDGANLTPDQLIFDDLDMYFEKLKQIAQDADAKARALDLVQSELYEHTMGGYAQTLVNYCQEAYRLAYRRLEQQQ